MTLAIDAPPLFPQAIPDLQRQADTSKCFQIYLLCVHAKGTDDVATIRQLDEAGCRRDLSRDLTTTSTGDVHDLLSPKSYPAARPEKRRRTAFDNPLLHQASRSSVSLACRLPESKRFNGVRYRPDRKTWTAEMKPPKYKNKVFFGEFKAQTLAARVVDAAFYYYSKPHLLNFRDSPQILSSSPTAAGLLGEDEKLGFVKEQAKWLASIASSLPFPNPNPCLPSEIGFQDALQGFVHSPTGIPAKLSSSSKLSPKLSPYFSTSSLASHAL